MQTKLWERAVGEEEAEHSKVFTMFTNCAINFPIWMIAVEFRVTGAEIVEASAQRISRGVSLWNGEGNSGAKVLPLIVGGGINLAVGNFVEGELCLDL